MLSCLPSANEINKKMQINWIRKITTTTKMQIVELVKITINKKMQIIE